MEILKSYRYRLEPTEEQKVLLNKHFGSTRYVYNHFLNEKNTASVWKQKVSLHEGEF